MNTETIRAELRTLNISEVARRAGVTRQGLSRFVNMTGRGLQSRTADRVAVAIEELRAHLAAPPIPSSSTGPASTQAQNARNPQEIAA